jgi:hypothetical protein
MAIQSSKIILRSCVIAAMSGVFGVAMVYPSLSQSPHATVMKFGGSWNGGGTVSPLSGGKERVNCKVTFDVKASSFKQDVDCSGSKMKFDIDGDLNTQGSNIEGKWSDKVSGYSGGASGTIGNNKLDLNIVGPGFTGRMNIAISGGSQTVKVTQYDVKTKGYKTVADIKLSK